MSRKKQTIIKIKMLCFVCEKPGNVMKFTDERLDKCHKILAFRKKKVFKYRDIKVPRSLVDKGYHTTCYNRFIVIRSSNRQEFESMFKNKAAVFKNGQDLAVSSKEESVETSFASTTTQNTLEIQMPRPIKAPDFKSEINENETCVIKIEDDIKQETHTPTLNISIPKMENPFSYFQMETEPSYLDPDLSKAVILKSILTRKTPIKKDMAKDTFEFDSGFDFLRTYERPNLDGVNQIDLNPPIQNSELKIINTTSLVDTGICIFCNNRERKIGTQRDFPITSKDQKIYEKVLSCAEGLKDFNILTKLETNKEFPCHPLCRTEYRHKYEKLSRKNCDDQDWLVFKNLYAEAFDGLCAFIDDKIIDKHKTYFLSDLYERYKALLFEIQNCATPFDFVNYSPQNLQEKIVKRYNGVINITTSKVLKRKIVYNGDVTTDVNTAVVENEDFKYDKLAFELRGVIKSMKRDNPERKSDEIPEQLFRFVGSLIQGPDVRQMNSYEDCVRVKSMCEDIVNRIMKEG